MPWLPLPLTLIWIALFGPPLAAAAFVSTLIISFFYCAVLSDESSGRKVLRTLIFMLGLLTLIALGVRFGTAFDEDAPRMCAHVQC